MLSSFLNSILQTPKSKSRIDFNRRTVNSILSDDVSLNSIEGHHITALPGTYVDKHTHVGSYSWIGYNCFVTKAVIQRYVGIGNNVTIGPGEHITSRVSNSGLFYKNIYEELTKGDCVIEHDAWIGVDSIIKRGVTIGIGAVIGANSFVNQNVPPFAIVAGSPARLVRFRFPPEQVKIILESRWWEKDFEDARLILANLEIILRS